MCPLAASQRLPPLGARGDGARPSWSDAREEELDVTIVDHSYSYPMSEYTQSELDVKCTPTGTGPLKDGPYAGHCRESRDGSRGASEVLVDPVALAAPAGRCTIRFFRVTITLLSTDSSDRFRMVLGLDALHPCQAYL